jgi:hypothetical protein
MTVGKFITRTLKFAANLIIILTVAMSTYYIFSELTTLPPKAEALLLEPEGTNFGKNPASYLTGELISKVLKGDYFVDSTGDVGALDARNAVEDGLGYYAFDYSTDFSATQIYSNAYMDGINLWLGKWGVQEYGLGYAEGSDYGFDDYDYENRRPKLNAAGDALIAPTFHFADYTEMEAKLKDPNFTSSISPNGVAITSDDVTIILGYWVLRVASQVDSYVLARGKRSTGGGGGSGGMSGINLEGVLLLNTIEFNFFGHSVSKNATIITGANAKIGLQVLGPLLTVADYSASGGTKKLDGTGDNYWYSAKANADRAKLSSTEYEGPDGTYVKNGSDNNTPPPTKAELQAIYDAHTPTKTETKKIRVTTDDDLGNEIELDGTLDKLSLCEFGMPASTLSSHIIDFRTIKGVELALPKADADYYAADITCYSQTDGLEWAFVSYESAKGIANSIGGLTEVNGGPVGYLNYTKLTATVQVWRNGMPRLWATDEWWIAELAGLIVATVTAGTTDVYTYDVNDILTDPNGKGVSLPELQARLYSFF